MFLQNRDRLVCYLSWDWKENPNWKVILEFTKFIHDKGYEPEIYNMNSDSDEDVIIICTTFMSRDEATHIFKNYEIYFGLEDDI